MIQVGYHIVISCHYLHNWRGSDQVWPNVKTQIMDTRPKMTTMMTMSSTTMIIPTINMMTKMRLTVENDVDDVDDDDDEEENF